MTCPNCQISEFLLPNGGILALNNPHQYVLGKIAYIVESLNPYYRYGFLIIPYHSDDLMTILKDFRHILSDAEMQDTQVLFLSDIEAPSTSLLQAFGRMTSLRRLWGKVYHQPILQMMNVDNLRSYLQPIVNLHDGRVFGYESLIRGHKGDLRIPAYDLIDAARDAGSLFPLDRLATEIALRKKADHLTDGEKIFVNFMPSTIYDPEICLKQTFEVLDACQISPEDVVFEVVETESVADRQHLVRIADYYRQKGVQIALDDLASGYSSLSYIAEIKPDYVKVDQGLIRGVSLDRIRRIIVEAIVHLCGQLNITTLAEGIENDEDLAFCADMGFDLAQGFWVGRPDEDPIGLSPDFQGWWAQHLRLATRA